MYDFNFSEPGMTTWTLLRQAWTAANKVSEIKLAKANITPEKLSVLWACKNYPPPLIPAEISRLTTRENQTIAGLLNRMENEGLIKRTPKRRGQPYTEIKMTNKGDKLVDPGMKVQMDLISKFMADFTKEEHEQFQKLLKKVRDRAADELHEDVVYPKAYPKGKAIPVKLTK